MASAHTGRNTLSTGALAAAVEARKFGETTNSHLGERKRVRCWQYYRCENSSFQKHLCWAGEDRCGEIKAKDIQKQV